MPMFILAVIACPPEAVDAEAWCDALQSGSANVADWNRDGAVDELDLAAYVADYFAGEPCADLDCAGLNADDLGEFINAWAGGA